MNNAIRSIYTVALCSEAEINSWGDDDQSVRVEGILNVKLLNAEGILDREDGCNAMSDITLKLDVSLGSESQHIVKDEISKWIPPTKGFYFGIDYARGV